MKSKMIVRLSVFSCVLYNIFFWVGLFFFRPVFFTTSFMQLVQENEWVLTVLGFYEIVAFYFVLYLPALEVFLSRRQLITKNVSIKKRRLVNGIFLAAGILLSLLLWNQPSRIGSILNFTLLWVELYSVRLLYLIWQAGKQNPQAEQKADG